MDILNVIKRDHDTIKGLTARLATIAEDPSAESDDLVDELAVTTKVLFRAEESALYAECDQSRQALHEYVQKGRFTHSLIEATITQLGKRQPGDDGKFKAVLSVLDELIDRHFKEEEEQIFPMIANSFTEQEREPLGGRMQQLREVHRDKIVRARQASGPAGAKRKNAATEKRADLPE
jgi:hemerythrin superfamily protein